MSKAVTRRVQNVPSTRQYCDKVVFFLVLTHHEVFCGREGMEKIIDQGSNLDRSFFPVLDLDHVDDSLLIVLGQKITKDTQTCTCLCNREVSVRSVFTFKPL